jgi:hypothetical protein
MVPTTTRTGGTHRNAIHWYPSNANPWYPMARVMTRWSSIHNEGTQMAADIMSRSMFIMEESGI